MSSASGGSENDRRSIPSIGTKTIDNTIERTGTFDETVLGSVTTKYHDVQSFPKFEERLCEDDKQHNLFKVDRFLRKDDAATLVKFDDSSNDSERAATSASTTSQLKASFQQTDASPPTTNPQLRIECNYSHADLKHKHTTIEEKSVKQRTYVDNSRVLECGWLDANFVSRQDDDYVAIADYCQPKLEKDADKGLSPKKSLINSVRWENMASAKAGDTDFASVQDYSFTSSDRQFASKFCRDRGTKLASYRALLARRRHSRRKKYVGIVGLILILVTCIHFNRKQKFQRFIVQVASNRNLSMLLQKCTNTSIFSTIWPTADITFGKDLIGITSIIDTNDFWYKIHENMCAMECLDLFENKSSTVLLFVPVDCYGAIHLHETPSRHNLEEQTTNQRSKSLNICLIPIVSNVLRRCRGAYRQKTT
jgi:hypothetical protein